MEWYYSDARTYRWVFGITAVLFAAFLTARDVFDSSDSWWFQSWWVWLIVVGVGLIMVLVGRSFRFSAGADWLMDRKKIVKTYELSVVMMDKDFDEGELQLQDRQGNQLSVGVGSLRLNEALWDLVYNGIRHSVANGAQVNRMAVDRLGLYDVLAIREERWFDQRSE